MLIKILFTLLVIITIFLNSLTYSYNAELVFLDEGKTIKELKENIENLDKENIELNNELEELNTDFKLKSFLKKELLVSELNKIKLIVSEYNTNKSNIELLLFEKTKDSSSLINERKLLLEEKRKLYSGLIPYINTKFKNEYLEYIKGDAKIFNEQKDIATDIILKKEILSTKVESIEEKIQEHKDFINKNIKKVIETRLEEKISNLEKNETFKVLNKESKVKILNKTIIKIKIKIQNIKNSNIKTASGGIIQNNANILNKKIQTYYIAINKLEVFRDGLR